MQIEERWPECIECGDEYPPGRKRLGYKTCLECGNKIAAKEIALKKKSLVPQGPKQGMTFVGEEARRNQIKGTNKYRRS